VIGRLISLGHLNALADELLKDRLSPKVAITLCSDSPGLLSPRCAGRQFGNSVLQN
jgi:hypothetical protein